VRYTLFAWLIAWTRHEASTAICAPLCALLYGDEPVFLQAATDFARYLGLHADQVLEIYIGEGAVLQEQGRQIGHGAKMLADNR
jgi:hypothetical protein